MADFFILSLVMGVFSLGVCLYFWREGQFEDYEDVKYQLFQDEQDK